MKPFVIVWLIPVAIAGLLLVLAPGPGLEWSDRAITVPLETR